MSAWKKGPRRLHASTWAGSDNKYLLQPAGLLVLDTTRIKAPDFARYFSGSCGRAARNTNVLNKRETCNRGDSIISRRSICVPSKCIQTVRGLPPADPNDPSAKQITLRRAKVPRLVRRWPIQG